MFSPLSLETVVFVCVSVIVETVLWIAVQSSAQSIFKASPFALTRSANLSGRNPSPTVAVLIPLAPFSIAQIAHAFAREILSDGAT